MLRRFGEFGPLRNVNNFIESCNNLYRKLKYGIIAASGVVAFWGIFRAYVSLRKIKAEQTRSDADTRAAKAEIERLDRDKLEREKATLDKKHREIRDELTKLADVFTPDNTEGKNVENGKYVGKVEEIIKNVEEDKGLRQKILEAKGDIATTRQYLHMSIALVSYYMYDNKQGGKGSSVSKKILDSVKQIIENVLASKNHLDDLDPTVAYTVLLRKGEGMVEAYAKVSYFLGRVYFYLDKDAQRNYRDEAKRCFEMAHYLGKKSQLFEAFQSHLVGLNRILLDEAKELKEEGEITRALERVLKMYDDLVHDEDVYKLNYNHVSKFETTEYKENPRCQLDLLEARIKCCVELMSVGVDCKGKLIQYLSSVKLTGKYIDGRRQASALNTLSEVLLLCVKDGKVIELRSILEWVNREFRLVDPKFKLISIRDTNQADAALTILEKAYDLDDGSHVGTKAVQNILEIYKLLNGRELRYDSQISKWQKRYQDLQRIAAPNTRVAGSISNSAEFDRAMLIDDFEANAALLNIDISRELPIVSDGHKLLIIDSDKATRAYATGRDDVEVIYTNTQGVTASCADNALCTVLKAQSLRLEAFAYVKNSHAVAVIRCRDDIDTLNLLQKINSVELQENEQLWDIYQEIIVGGYSSNEDDNTVQVDNLLEPSTALSDLQALFDTNNVISQGIETLKYYLDHFSSVVPIYIDSLIAELQNIIPKTIAEEANLLRVIEQLNLFQGSYQIPSLSRYPAKYPNNDPDDDWYVIGGGIHKEPGAEMLLGNSTVNVTDYQ